jgi:hypothetical protein
VNPDFLDLLRLLLKAGARFMVVGAHAMAVHGVPRATGDLDVWVDLDSANAALVWAALLEFGAPVSAVGIRREDLEEPGIVIQIGQPPRRIDILTGISGVSFPDAWPRRVVHEVDGTAIPFLGQHDLIRNKRAAGRPKDLGSGPARTMIVA